MWILGALGLSHPFSFVNAMMFGTVVGATDPVADAASSPTYASIRSLRLPLRRPPSGRRRRGGAVQGDVRSSPGEDSPPSGVVHAAWAFFVVFGELRPSGSVGIGDLAIGAVFRWQSNSPSPRWQRNGEANGEATGGGRRRRGWLLRGSTNVDPDRKRRDRSMSAEEAVRGPELEASVVALFPDRSTCSREALELVGIVSILFCGRRMRARTRRTLRGRARAHPRAFGLMAQLSETFVFIYIGASVFWRSRGDFATAAWTVVMCLASRAVAVYPGAKLIDVHAPRARRSNPHPRRRGNVRVRRVQGWRRNARRRRFSAAARPSPTRTPHALVQRSTRRDGVRARARGAARRGDDGHAMLTGTLGAVLFTSSSSEASSPPALEHLGIRATRGGANGANGANGGGTFRDAGGSSSDARSEDEVAVLIRSENQTARRASAARRRRRRRRRGGTHVGRRDGG